MDHHDTADPRALGAYLKSLRLGLEMTLRDVEAATEKSVSNAYLSQVENGKILKPSPNILHALSQVYGVSYESLMRRAGFVTPAETMVSDRRHGRAATFAVENLTAAEEAELLKYLAWYRSRGRDS